MIAVTPAIAPAVQRPSHGVSAADKSGSARPAAAVGAVGAVGAAQTAARPAPAPETTPVQPVAAIRKLQAQQVAPRADAGPAQSAAAPSNSAGGGIGDVGLSESEQAVVEQLKARDREVRAHEQAHAAVGGQYASAPTYEYEVGPDGHRYAVGGEVKIDTAAVPDDPEATIEKMEIVKAAALAPAEPSAQDRKVAQLADQQRAQAQAQLFADRAAAQAGGGDGADEAGASGDRGAGDVGETGRRTEAERGYETSRAAQAAAQIVEIVAAA